MLKLYGHEARGATRRDATRRERVTNAKCVASRVSYLQYPNRGYIVAIGGVGSEATKGEVTLVSSRSNHQIYAIQIGRLYILHIYI